MLNKINQLWPLASGAVLYNPLYISNLANLGPCQTFLISDNSSHVLLGFLWRGDNVVHLLEFIFNLVLDLIQLFWQFLFLLRVRKRRHIFRPNWLVNSLERGRNDHLIFVLFLFDVQLLKLLLGALIRFIFQDIHNSFLIWLSFNF